jgi:hypothetical protein
LQEAANICGNDDFYCRANSGIGLPRKDITKVSRTLLKESRCSVKARRMPIANA